MTPTVTILIYVPAPEVFDTATLTLQTVRVGFPTAKIVSYAYMNCSVEQGKSFTRLCEKNNIDIAWVMSRPHHRNIECALNTHDWTAPLVILDGDLIFWDSCEDWHLYATVAGRFIPAHWSEYTDCYTAQRLHSSFLWFGASFKEVLDAVRPKIDLDYAPALFLQPQVVHQSNGPFFLDTGTQLLNMLVGWIQFSPAYLDCYDHIFCGSTMVTAQDHLCSKSKEDLCYTHALARETPKALKGLWRAQQRYYESRMTPPPYDKG